MTLCDVCSAEGYPYDEETCKECEYNPSKDRKGVLKMYCKTRDIQRETENHIKVLEETKQGISHVLPCIEELEDRAAYEEAKSRIDSLTFAIDFIKRGMMDNKPVEDKP